MAVVLVMVLEGAGAVARSLVAGIEPVLVLAAASPSYQSLTPLWPRQAACRCTGRTRLNGHDPYAYLKDVLERLPSQPASRIGELLPHRWKITAAAS